MKEIIVLYLDRIQTDETNIGIGWSAWGPHSPSPLPLLSVKDTYILPSQIIIGLMSWYFVSGVWLIASSCPFFAIFTHFSPSHFPLSLLYHAHLPLSLPLAMNQLSTYFSSVLKSDSDFSKSFLHLPCKSFSVLTPAPLPPPPAPPLVPVAELPLTRSLLCPLLPSR